MPIYASLADLLARFRELDLIQLTDDAGVGEVDQDKINQALTSADATIDGFLAARYQLPLARVPGNIVDIACDLARYDLYRDEPTEAVKDRRKAAMRMLEQIASGVIKIDAGAPEQPPRDGAILVGDGCAEFTRDKMKGF